MNAFIPKNSYIGLQYQFNWEQMKEHSTCHYGTDIQR